MADNPRKKGADRKRVSQQRHEQSYQRKRGSRSIEENSGRVTRGNASGRSGTEGGNDRGGESKR